jgi:endonuclease G
MARRRNVSGSFESGFDRGDVRQYNRLADSSFDAFRRLDPRWQMAVAAVLLAGLIVVSVLYFQAQRVHPQVAGPAAPSGSPDLFLGNPSGATADLSNRDNFLMLKPYYVLSYDDDNGTPNWVSWRLTSLDLGDAPRKPEFDPDLALPPGFNVVTSHDYSGSGFDRGHMCPHGDRTADLDMSYSTFVMTNIIPQAPNVNRKAWAQEEDYLRELVRRRHQRLYVVAGPVGQGGRGSDGFGQTTPRGRVVVPAACWKVAVAVADEGVDDLSEINAGTRVVTVLMPNDNDVVGDQWAGFRTSAAAVEQQTGLHFFDRLPPPVAQVLRQKVDDEPIPPPRPLGHGKD